MTKNSLIKSLGLVDVFCISSGAMISSGIFILPGIAFAQIGPAVFLSYLLAGICALVGALATIELRYGNAACGRNLFLYRAEYGTARRDGFRPAELECYRLEKFFRHLRNVGSPASVFQFRACSMRNHPDAPVSAGEPDRHPGGGHCPDHHGTAAVCRHGSLCRARFSGIETFPFFPSVHPGKRLLLSVCGGGICIRLFRGTP